ncbi:hypothetical protein G7Y79_00036g071660 [Physcia stellaris]|nr:hypothetical protein G7Y79_00036g071660 [Physcia stellaris]
MLYLRRCAASFLAFQILLFEFLLATPFYPRLGNSLQQIHAPIGNLTTSGNATNLLSALRTDAEVFSYEILGTDVSMDVVLFIHHPVERAALGAAIFSGRRWLETRLQEKGDDWLSDEDDPYLSIVPERCYIRVDSKKTRSGRSSMTYRTLLSVFEGLWAVIYLGRRDYELSLRIHVAGQLAGYGAIRIREVNNLAAA